MRLGLTIAFHFSFENHLRKSMMTMVKQYIRVAMVMLLLTLAYRSNRRSLQPLLWRLCLLARLPGAIGLTFEKRSVGRTCHASAAASTSRRAPAPSVAARIQNHTRW